MNIFVKSWLKALRSGKFRQAREALRGRNRSFCCLGVACELAQKKKLVQYDPKDRSYDKEESNLPLKVRDALKLKSNVGDFEYTQPFLKRVGKRDPTLEVKLRKNIGFTCLAQLNDALRLNFKEIATVIECKPKGLFRK